MRDATAIITRKLPQTIYICFIYPIYIGQPN